MYTGKATNVAQTLLELPDLVNNLLLLLSDKEKSVVSKRFSLNGMPKCTLEQVGKEFSVTRERVRQIEKNALSKMRRNVFNTSLRHLHDFALSVVTENGGILKEDHLFSEVQGLLPEKFTVDEGSLHLSLVLHEGLECVGNTINFYPYVRDNNVSDYYLKHASNHLINQLHKYGDVKPIDKLHNDLKPVFTEINFDPVRVRSLVRIDKRLTILDDDLVGLVEWRHIHPRTLRDKILYILRKERNSMHFRDIADKISNEKFDRRSINIQAVHNELIRHEQFVLIGRGIYALSEWGYEGGTVATVISRILKKHKELSQDEIVDIVLKQRQVKKITILLALKNNNVFERIGRKRYRLKVKAAKA